MYLALDQGGHASRALVFDEQGVVRARGKVEVAVNRNGKRVEHDAGEVVASLRRAAEEALSQLDDAEEVTSAGLACQRSSLVCWRRDDGAALTPVISWQDRRAAADLSLFHEHEERIAARTGLRLSAHYGATKLRWCARELPEVRAAGAAGKLAWGPLASFIVRSLTGTVHADPANAQRTLLYAVEDRAWDRELIELFDVAAGELPTCGDSVADLGSLSVGGRHIPLRIVTGDQSAAVFSAGDPTPDEVLINIGTGAFLQRAFAEHHSAPHGLLTSLVHAHGPRTRWVCEGAVHGAGAALATESSVLGVPIEELGAALAELLEAGAPAPLFLNGVSGLGSPFWIPDFESRFVGEGTPRALFGAVLESVVFLIRLNLDLLQSLEPRVRSLRVCGGVTRSDAACRLLADVTGLEVVRSEEPEATARGLAWLLAGVDREWRSIGHWHDDTEDEHFAPVAANERDERYRRWLELMPQA